MGEGGLNDEGDEGGDEEEVEGVWPSLLVLLVLVVRTLGGGEADGGGSWLLGKEEREAIVGSWSVCVDVDGLG